MIRDNGYQIMTTNYKLLQLVKTILIPEFRSTVIDMEKILNSSRCFRFSCTAVVSDNIKRLVSREAGFCLYSWAQNHSFYRFLDLMMPFPMWYSM